MASKTTDALNSRIARTKTPRPEAPPVGKSLEAGKSVGQPGSEKLNLSVYSHDTGIINQLKRFFMDNDIEANTSEVMRVVLRAAEPGPKLVKLYREMEAEDGRRRAKGRTI